MRKLIAVAVVGTVIFGAFLPITPASAYISGTSGAITKISPPASVKNQQLTSASTMFAFEERQGVQLASAVPVDITTPGNYESNASLTTEIPAGTIVDSHYINSVRVSGSGTTVLTGTLTFPTDVIGIIVTPGKLGNRRRARLARHRLRAREPRPRPRLGTHGDSLDFSGPRTVTLTSSEGNGSDQVRIITTHDSPPVANAGGPYTGTEGASTTLHGSPPTRTTTRSSRRGRSTRHRDPAPCVLPAPQTRFRPRSPATTTGRDRHAQRVGSVP